MNLNKALSEFINEATKESIFQSLKESIESHLRDHIESTLDDILDENAEAIQGKIQEVINEYISTNEFRELVLGVLKEQTREELPEWVMDAFREYMERVLSAV